MVRTQLEMEGATAETAEVFVDHAVAMAEAQQYVADSGINLANATEIEIQELVAEATTLGIDSVALTEYLILKGQANGGIWNLNLEALLEEYEELGYNCDKLREYIVLKNAAGSNGNFVGQFTSAQDFQNYQNAMNAAQEEIRNNTKRPLTYDIPEIKRASGGAGKDAGKSYVDGFNEELSKLKESYERGKYFASVA